MPLTTTNKCRPFFSLGFALWVGAAHADRIAGAPAPLPADSQQGSQATESTDEVVKMESFEVTSSLGNYAESTASIGAKIPTETVLLPSSVQVLNANFINDTRAISLDSIYSYVVGLQRTGIAVADFNLRGFNTNGSGFNLRSMQEDGLPGMPIRIGSPDTSNIERVENLKGPASLLYGLINPGGIINIVTKQPQDTPHQEFTGSVGTYDGSEKSFGSAQTYNAAIDTTGPIGSGRRLLYRLIASYDDVNNWRGQTIHSYEIFPSLAYRWDKDTSITVQAEISRQEQRPLDLIGLVVPFNNPYDAAPPTTFYGNKTDSDHESGEDISTHFKHVFADGWVLAAAERSNYEVGRQTRLDTQTITSVLPVQNSTLTRRFRDLLGYNRSHVFDANVFGDVGPDYFKQTLLFGITASEEYTDQLFLANGPNVAAINIYNPPAFTPYPPAGTGTQNAESLYWYYSGYFADHFRIAQHWLPSVGVRYDHLTTVYHEYVAGVYIPQVFEKAIPYAALMYAFTDDFSAYVSDSYSFVPNVVTTRDVNNNYNNFPPQTAQQAEVGLKASLLNRKLNFTLAAFDIKKKNVVEAVGKNNSAGNAISVLSGLQESEGAELQTSWLPIPNWEVQVGAAYLPKAKIDQSVTALVGHRLGEDPRLNASFWTRYNWPSGILKHFGVGLGVSFVGPQYLTTGLLVPVASYTLVNPALYYQMKRYSIALNVNNLLDTKYFPYNSENGLGIEPGDPRKLTLTFKIGF